MDKVESLRTHAEVLSIFGFTVCVAIGFLFFSVSRYYSLGVRSVYDDDHSYLIRLLKPGRNTCVIIEREEEGGGV